MKIKKLESVAIEAIRKLRENKLLNGNPFMINCVELPPQQCYLEYPDGNIHLVTIRPDRLDFMLIRRLNEREIQYLRKKYSLCKVL
ncbi:MAG: hypothetical protein ACHQF0_03445 [Chitinophagales bacterium]